ncbi:DMT family transporter [Pendulispora albinea]|uniref:DMT family transporter n=1 Tax=Pendulispora albinea TaxID=2741071 RepID=A0ABZ2LT19_9BACT
MARSPISAGVLLALAAALAFGSTTPFVHRFGAGVGPFATACLLYAGAALVAVFWRGRADAEARVRREHLPRIVLVAMFGAVVAPAALAWGLQHADAASASLLLNFEAAATVLLARWFFGESLGGRVWGAVLAMVAGGGLLVVASAGGALGARWGLLAVLLATLAWAADNTLTRPLSDLDPMGLIARKAAFGAVFTGVLAMAFGEVLPSARGAAGLLACGASGYGVSLRLYLLAQRRLGAARTGSVFAVAPFVGAGLAWALEGAPNGADGRAGALTVLAGGLFALAVYLHLSEAHSHEHTHAAMVHEHAHRHDDGHHDHVHDPPVTGAHSHVHAHTDVTHTHEHAPDVHHGHLHS